MNEDFEKLKQEPEPIAEKAAEPAGGRQLRKRKAPVDNAEPLVSTSNKDKGTNKKTVCLTLFIVFNNCICFNLNSNWYQRISLAER